MPRPVHGDRLPEVDLIRRRAMASRFRELRTRLGLSQEEVARRAGLDRGFYAELEGAKRGVTVDRLWHIAGALGVHPKALLWDAPPDDDPEDGPDAGGGGGPAL